MNESNFKNITEVVLPKIGIPDGIMDEQILTMMKNNPGSFVAKVATNIGGDEIQYDLKFAKNQKNPEDLNYYLNTLTATLTQPDGEVRKHEFQYFFTNGYNIEQINNIMSGRTVYSEFPKKDGAPGEKNRMWFGINLTEKDDQGMNKRYPTFENTTGFNLVIEAGKIPVVNQSVDEKNRMLHELRNGNEYQANVKMPDGSVQRATIEARPHINQVVATGMDGKRLTFDKSKMQAIPLSNNQGKGVTGTTGAILGHDDKGKGQTGGKRNTATG